jgi:hypothetical protein
VLKEEKVGREKLFIHPKYMQLLTSDTHQFGLYENARAMGAKNKPAATKARKTAPKKRK